MRDAAVDVWGGVECSVVRTPNGVRNQLMDTGHLKRPGDIELIAGLGLKTVRYPVLWEMVEAERGKQDWSWTDDRLNRLKEHGIAPIAGLVHHGSGPEWTDLLDPEFPEKLAVYAGRVAERYPWISMYTPVNEPFTTARLCALYGLWHPFTRDEATCFRVTVNECIGVAKAMRAIRKINPAAKLVQTEDFGRIYATARLKYQADYENERRWLSIDLLTGRVKPGHRLYRRLLASGISAEQLEELAAAPCPPDIIGIDYYLTSDRVLDHRAELYPGEELGGNGREIYVDVAAVRSDLPKERQGLAGRLRELWERYRLPIAITELHNGCTRDEQLRWYMEGWNTACHLKSQGVDIRGVSSWSLFGACDWNTMMTREEGHYESGAFDSRYDPPQRTIVGHALARLATEGQFDHPVLDRPGWWRREDAADHAARPLVLSGFDRHISAIEEVCSRRRLRTVAAGTSHDRAETFNRHNAWAMVRIEHGKQGSSRKTVPRKLHCEFADGEVLSLELPGSPDWHAFADTFLDLIVDRRIGNMRFIGPPKSTVTGALVAELEAGHSAKNSAA